MVEAAQLVRRRAAERQPVRRRTTVAAQLVRQRAVEPQPVRRRTAVAAQLVRQRAVEPQPARPGLPEGAPPLAPARATVRARLPPNASRPA